MVDIGFGLKYIFYVRIAKYLCKETQIISCKFCKVCPFVCEMWFLVWAADEGRAETLNRQTSGLNTVQFQIEMDGIVF